MILKHFEINKLNYDLNNKILFYGNNRGLIKEKINFITSKHSNYKIINYDQLEIIHDDKIIFNEILNKSFFDNEKILIINNLTDKLSNLILEISKNFLDNIILILISDKLEKKSKLRNFFEKEKNLICVPVYPDDNTTLSQIAHTFLKNRKISISQSDLNLIIDRCKNDRENLLKELEKISLFALNKKIDTDSILKLTNLIENYDISELIDACINKNLKKTINILNENNFNSEDSIIILKIFLNKMKRLMTLNKIFEKNNDISLTINQARPPIFWKEKVIVKQQVLKWSQSSIKDLIFELNDVELQIKKNINNSVNILSNFIIDKCLLKSNN